MADVTTTFAAKDEGFAAVMQRIQNRLQKFTQQMGQVSANSKQIQTSFTGMTQSVVGLAAAYVGVSQAISGFNKALELGGQLDDLTKRTGATAGELLVLREAFELGGASADMVGPVLSRLSKFLAEAQLGGQAQIEVLKRLGLTYDQLGRLAPTQQLALLAQKLMGIRDPALRTKTAVDLFSRAGAELLPLFFDFNGELEKARGYLGSMPEIMDASASKMADLGDAVAQIGKKFTQFSTGFISGASGINDVAEAIAKFDAAASGLDLGQLFSGAIAEPHKAFLLLGEVLLLAIKKAGNELINATLYAGKVWTDALTNKKTFGTIMEGLLAGFQSIFNFAATVSLQIVKTLIEGVAGLVSVIPGVGPALAREIAAPLKAIEEQQSRIDKQAEKLRQTMQQSLFGTAEDVIETAKKMPKEDVDFLGANDQQQQVTALQENLKQIARDNSTEPKKETPAEQMDRARSIYAQQIAAIEAMEISATEQTKKRIRLDAQFIEAMNAARQGLLPPAEQMKQATTGKNEREAMADAQSKPLADSGETKGAASETTLQKAVRFLEDLTAKLPSPVLV